MSPFYKKIELVFEKSFTFLNIPSELANGKKIFVTCISTLDGCGLDVPALHCTYADASLPRSSQSNTGATANWASAR
jgi:hypothetical protein